MFQVRYATYQAVNPITLGKIQIQTPRKISNENVSIGYVYHVLISKNLQLLIHVVLKLNWGEAGFIWVAM